MLKMLIRVTLFRNKYIAKLTSLIFALFCTLVLVIFRRMFPLYGIKNSTLTTHTDDDRKEERRLNGKVGEWEWASQLQLQCFEHMLVAMLALNLFVFCTAHSSLYLAFINDARERYLPLPSSSVFTSARCVVRLMPFLSNNQHHK